MYYVFFSVDLLGLLKWKDHLDKIDTNLEKLMSLEGEEIVKVRYDLILIKFIY